MQNDRRIFVLILFERTANDLISFFVPNELVKLIKAGKGENTLEKIKRKKRRKIRPIIDRNELCKI